jgi:DNA-binding NtrC family response regulator
MPLPRLLIVDDDALISESLAFALGESFAVTTAASRDEALRMLSESIEPPNIALVDLGLPPHTASPVEGFKLIESIVAQWPTLPVVVLSGQNEERHAKQARALGAFDFASKPVSPAFLEQRLNAALKSCDSRLAASSINAVPELIGTSPPMQALKDQIEVYASAPFAVLISGESGVGKERVARALARISDQRAGRVRPWLALNCAALSANLVESTLFGHAKGAFTGAHQAHVGFFEQAEDGMLFLDEIGELSPEAQAKLLRVLETGEFHRVGETHARKTNARVIAATHRDLRAATREGSFRTDLFYRLSVLTLYVPALRELGEDALMLFDFFAHGLRTEHGLAPISLTPQARSLLLRYDFPGNARELKNIVIRLTARLAGRAITPEQLLAELDPTALRTPEPDAHSSVDAVDRITSQAMDDGVFLLEDYLHARERECIDLAMTKAQGNMTQAAKLLGIHRATLYTRIEVTGAQRRK